MRHEIFDRDMRGEMVSLPASSIKSKSKTPFPDIGFI